MRNVLLVALAVSVSAVSAMAQESKPKSDVALSAIYYKPGQGDDYDIGYGAEAQIRYWLKSEVGLALSVGSAAWTVNEREAIMGDAYSTFGASLDGDVAMLPIGGSVLFRPIHGESLSLTFEAGLRYVVVDSGIDFTMVAADQSSLFAIHDTVEIEDGAVGVLGASVESRISKTASLFAGISYQLDISKGEATFLGEDLGSNELEALMVKVGIEIKLGPK